MFGKKDYDAVKCWFIIIFSTWFHRNCKELFDKQFLFIYSQIVMMVVVLVIRYAIRSAKSGHPAVGQSLDRLVQRWLGADVSVVASTFLSWGSSRIIQTNKLYRCKLLSVNCSI